MKQEKAPVSAATLTGGRTEKHGEQNPYHSEIDSSTNQPETQGQIARLLGVGEKNAIRASELAAMAGCSSVRQLQQRIAAEVDKTDALILCCPDGRGYFLAGSRAELLRYEAQLHNRAINTLRRLHAVRAALKRVEGQLAIEGDGNDGESD